MPPTRTDCFLFLTTTTPHNPHPEFLISPQFIYSCWPKYRFDHCCPALMLFLPLFDTERRHSSKMIVVNYLLVSRRFLGYWMHPTLRFIIGVAQCHRMIRRTLAPSSRRVSSPRHVPSPRRVLFRPACAFVSSYLFLGTSPSASTSPPTLLKLLSSSRERLATTSELPLTVS